MKRKSSIYTVTLVGLMGAMCFNKTAMLPPRFCLMQTANDPDSVRSMPGIQERIQEFAAHIEATLLGT